MVGELRSWEQFVVASLAPFCDSEDESSFSLRGSFSRQARRGGRGGDFFPGRVGHQNSAITLLFRLFNPPRPNVDPSRWGKIHTQLKPIRPSDRAFARQKGGKCSTFPALRRCKTRARLMKLGIGPFSSAVFCLPCRIYPLSRERVSSCTHVRILLMRPFVSTLSLPFPLFPRLWRLTPLGRHRSLASSLLLPLVSLP